MSMRITINLHSASRFSATLLTLLLSIATANQTFAQATPIAASHNNYDDLAKNSDTVRFATFNVSFHRSSAGKLTKDLNTETPKAQPRSVAEVIQRVRPDVLLLNEFDYDAGGKAIQAFQKNLLGVSQKSQPPIQYPHVYLAPVNTGVPSGADLNGDNKIETSGSDAFGYGQFPGQYGMVVLSKFPIQPNQVRTFQTFLWKDMPGNLMPQKAGTNEPFYSAPATAIFRLSSKSHWDVPIDINGKTIHFLVAHPTPPVFDTAEDRNGRRNHDEIRMFADYVTPGKAHYLYDDHGVKGGLPADSHFVIAGDMNSDPNDGDSRPTAAAQLTAHPLINQQQTPQSSGATSAASAQGLKNLKHKSDPKFDTGDFDDRRTGNLRLDYCLPSKTLQIKKSGVFWPDNDPTKLNHASDHHLVWVDVDVD